MSDYPGRSNDIEDLLARAKAILKEGITAQPAFKNERPVGMPARSYHLPRAFYADENKRIPIEVTKDRAYLDIYLPSRNNVLLELTEVTIVLHGHKPLLGCKPEDFCHEYGFQSEHPDFKTKWRNFYGLSKPLGKIDLGF